MHAKVIISYNDDAYTIHNQLRPFIPEGERAQLKASFLHAEIREVGKAFLSIPRIICRAISHS
ncbi:hypothetical protein C7475_105198 [Chitinophaga sp. S165]|nr:hypothetical protein C7475_105198 [Chitinophaga sp. S165]